MDNREIAMRLTIAAMNSDPSFKSTPRIPAIGVSTTSYESYIEAIEENAKTVVHFYKTILEHIDS